MKESENINEKEEQMLSTLDNPYNPFTHFELWNQYDQEKGYNTLAYLGRIVDYTDCVTEEQKREARELAIEQIITIDPLQIYCRVSKDEIVKPIDITLNKTN